MDYSNKSVLVYDYGMWPTLAQRLSRDFGKVYYFNPTQKSSFPTSKFAWVGYGVPGVIQVDDFWEIADEVDLFVFPDLYDWDLQLKLVDMGKRVWGLRKLEILETDREYFRNVQVDLGLNVPETVICHGITSLKEFLKDATDKYIKLSYYRGDSETFHWRSMELDEPWLGELEGDMGLQVDECDFFVENPIEGIESGYDMYVVDGQIPETIALGYEIKDACYLFKFVKYTDMPKEFQAINEAMIPLFKKSGARGFFSTEIRVDKQRNCYLLDFCARLGSPTFEAQMEMYKNLADILWFGADGKLVEPEITDEYGAILNIYVQAEGRDKWIYVDFPEDLKDNVKLKNLAMKNGKSYYVPTIENLREIGGIIAEGHSFDDVIEKLKLYSADVKGYEIEIRTENLDKAMDTITEGEYYGIIFK